ncbi:hypothetical protein SAMN04487886_104114 [Clostridium sp. DSM 8431]|nr:hypothetical protein SAMN04487886_104114 [Clostridium sp. DSM 8431]
MRYLIIENISDNFGIKKHIHIKNLFISFLKYFFSSYRVFLNSKLIS